MKIWLTADQHFNHASIIQHCNRPFDSVDAMNAFLVDKWNGIVNDADIVYVLGDFTLDKRVAPFWFGCLKGRIRVVPGGHDTWLSVPCVSASGIPVEVLPPIYVGRIAPGVNAVMCHYPMLTWEQSHYGRIHVHGHSHGAIPPQGRRMDVGVDVTGYQPILGEYVADLMKAKEVT